MPWFEYRCKKCGNIIDRITNSNDAEIICDKCNGKAKKIMSVSNFRINGYSYSNGYSKGDK